MREESGEVCMKKDVCAEKEKVSAYLCLFFLPQTIEMGEKHSVLKLLSFHKW